MHDPNNLGFCEALSRLGILFLTMMSTFVLFQPCNTDMGVLDVASIFADLGSR